MRHITSVNRLTYVMDASPATSVTLFVNKSQYAGRYASIDDAQIAAQGLLTKCGCSKPAQRILNIPQEIVSPGLRTYLALPNWSDIAVEYDTVGLTFRYNTSQVIQSLNGNAVVLQLSGTQKSVSLYVKKSSSSMAANLFVDPITDGYTQVTVFPAYLIVSNLEYVRFKSNHNYPLPYPVVASALELITVTNLSDSGSAVDTFNMNYSVLI